jgi:hypothetical protein
MLLGLALCLLRGRLYEPAIAETPGRNGFAEPSQEVGVIRRGIVLKPPCAVPRDKAGLTPHPRCRSERTCRARRSQSRPRRRRRLSGDS